MTSAQRHRDGWKHTEWLLTEQLRQSPAFSPAGPVSLNPKILSFEEGLEKLQPTLPRSGDPTVWTGVSPKHNDSHGAGPCPPGPRWLSIWVCDACLRKQPAAGPGHTTWFLCRPSVGAVPLAGISVLSPSPPSWSYVMLHFPWANTHPRGGGTGVAPTPLKCTATCGVGVVVGGPPSSHVACSSPGLSLEQLISLRSSPRLLPTLRPPAPRTLSSKVNASPTSAAV